MPTITIDLDDLRSLLRKSISVEELSSLLFLYKCLLEGVEGNEMSIEVTADRPDLLSVEGLARALRLFIGLEEPRRYEAVNGDVEVKVDPSVLEVRPFILCAVVRGVRLSDEAVRQLMMLQEKLHLTYCRRRVKASIGLHDLRAVTPKITYAALPPSEIRFTPLDEVEEMNGYEVLERTAKGREYGFIIKGFDKYPLLFDEEGRVLSMPPIINGNVTKVSSSTRDLFIDVTGTDLDTVGKVLNIVALSAAERGGMVEKVKVIFPDKLLTPPFLDPPTVKVELSYVKSLLGLSLSSEEVGSCLRRMGYFVKVGEGFVEAQPPPYRVDILHPVDVVEDVAVGYGYDKIRPERPSRTQVGCLLDITRLSDVARELMTGLGFQEVLSYTLTSPDVIGLNRQVSLSDAVSLENPVSLEYACLRTWLIPILLAFLSHNRHVELPQRVFECGDVVLVDRSKPTSTRVERRLAAAICDRKAGYEDAQAYLYAFLRNLGFTRWIVEPLVHPAFIEGRAATVIIDGAEVAKLGEVSPEVLVYFRLENPIACFEVNLSRILDLSVSQTKCGRSG